MHDVWPLTGHCAYPLTCEHWRVGCGDCPDLALPIPIRRDASAENCRIKRQALGAGKRLRVATPSHWLMRLVEESGLADSLAETRVVPNGVDTEVFSPGDQREARSKLGLPLDATIVLFSARSAKSSPFKGFETLEAALPLIARTEVVSNLLLVSLGEDASDSSVEGVPIHFVNFADDPATVARYYQAADLYLHPARAESFGLAVLEAMACGVPVVASDVGGIPEIIADGESGLLVPSEDAAALAAATAALLGDSGRRSRMVAAGLSRARNEFSHERQVQGYLDWYLTLSQAPVAQP
jgi:glycosyltransferase involved in cell wall biosynthesis